MDFERVYMLVERDAVGCRFIRNFTGKQMRFYERPGADAMAAGLRRRGRDVEVVEIDVSEPTDFS